MLLNVLQIMTSPILALVKSLLFYKLLQSTQLSIYCSQYCYIVCLTNTLINQILLKMCDNCRQLYFSIFASCALNIEAVRGKDEISTKAHRILHKRYIQYFYTVIIYQRIKSKDIANQKIHSFNRNSSKEAVVIGMICA